MTWDPNHAIGLLPSMGLYSCLVFKDDNSGCKGHLQYATVNVFRLFDLMNSIVSYYNAKRECCRHFLLTTTTLMEIDPTVIYSVVCTKPYISEKSLPTIGWNRCMH